MKRLTIGLLAHVDAGKTTLSEAMLYQAGAVRRLGRVDHKDAFLDTDWQERERGITIFSKQARLTWRDCGITLLDTPGHVDFSAETERAVQVLDCAVLLVSGADGVQGHTETLWRLLARHGVPTSRTLTGTSCWPSSGSGWTRAAPTSPGTGGRCWSRRPCATRG